MELIRPNSTFLRFTWLARAGEIARRHWALALAFSFPLAMYTITLAGTVFGLDSAEFSAAAYSLGVPHATGYPLYMMLGKLFTFLPMGDVGYRLNLMSAVFAAFTVAVVYQILLLVTTRALLSLALSLFFAFSYYFWTASVIAEVYTLHALLTGLVILMWLMWNQKQDRKLLYLAAAIWGLSFGNHISTVLLGPAFGYMLLVAFQRKALPWQSLMVMAGLFILGLSTYAYLPWRYLAEATPHVGRFDNEGVFTRIDLTSIQGMWWMLSGKDYGAFLFPYDLLGALNELAQYNLWLLANFLGVGVALGIVGMLRSALIQRPGFVFLGLIFVANVAFFVNYGALDKDTMFLPTYLVWTIWMGVGAGFLLDTIKRRREADRLQHPGRAPTPITRMPWEKVAFVLPLAALIINFSYADLSSDQSVRQKYTAILAAVEEDALLLGWWPDTTPMVYLQHVEGMRPDVSIIHRSWITRGDETKLINSAVHERPVYVLGPLPIFSQPLELTPMSGGHKLSLPSADDS